MASKASSGVDTLSHLTVWLTDERLNGRSLLDIRQEELVDNLDITLCGDTDGSHHIGKLLGAGGSLGRHGVCCCESVDELGIERL